MWHPYTRHSALVHGPLPSIVRGQGPYLFDAEGRRYLDAISSWWACSLGHSHPRLVAALQRQAGTLQHSILGNLSHPPAVELADRLLGLFPDRRRRVLFASDGACAVEAALRVAVQYWHNRGQPGRCRFAALQEAYHGDTLGAMSLGYLPAFHAAYSAITMPVHRVAAPCCHPCALGLAPATCRRECLHDLRCLLDRHAAELAAVVVEPLCLGAAGMRVYAPACLREIADLCRAAGPLLIVDEIAMGFGRTGRMFAFDHAGIDPDIVCLGKALTGGYLPVSAAVVREEIYETFGDAPADHTFYHGHTFAGNPVGTAVAVECLRIYEEEGIVAAACRKGELLRQRWQRGASVPGVTHPRSLGLMAAFDLVPPGGDATTGAQAAHAARRWLLDRGVLLRPLGNVLYVMPPLTTPDAVIEELVDMLFTAVTRVREQAN
ncbi:MAG: adenosylmethionine--8-amino-7-oxononanoate transaminase [Lentisphaerae bacterium RIFOXYB12_FULL_65_16]|nr:MAG: adenosylmethionine--8-amino-7-oxononanoate transaminase [Lentisphaerae bacterium RIFOXYA12_64_32]OGV88040.1 MAG: adenosylmethionine--8-amino-7-oxononanoate transaminase [Lentisphaerae bacterium RIFOXYB12_FULL_65_16]